MSKAELRHLRREAFARDLAEAVNHLAKIHGMDAAEVTACFASSTANSFARQLEIYDEEDDAADSKPAGQPC